MPQEQQKQKTTSFQNKQSKESSATCWTNLSAGEFLIDLQDFLLFRSEKVRPEQISREYAHHEKEANYFMDKIKEALLDKEVDDYFFIQLSDHLTGMEVESNLLFYRQGFSDGVRMIIQTLAMSGL